MERRKALAVAAASAGVFSTGLIASAAVMGFHLFGFGSPKASASASQDVGSPAAGLASAIATATIGTSPPPIYVKQMDFVDEYVVVTTTRPHPRPTTHAPTTGSTSSTTQQETTQPATTHPPTTQSAVTHPATTKPTTTTTRPHTSTTRHHTSTTAHTTSSTSDD